MISLNPEGPYLIYDNQRDDSQFTIANPDGSGATTLELPEDAYLTWLHKALSPQGQWLAFHAGSWEGPNADYALYLAHIPDGEIKLVSKLLSSEYPSDLQTIAERWPVELPGLFSADYDWEDLLPGDFAAGISALAWSPNGQYLAFAGQMDGPSSDVYVFNMQTEEIRRLTADIQNVRTITWSPDSKWVMLRNSIPGEIYDSATLHRLNPEGSLDRHPSILERGTWWGGLQWLSDNQYLLGNFYDGAIGDLWLLNVNTGQKTELWPTSYEAYAFDPEQKTLYISALIDVDTDPQNDNGLYSVTLDGQIKKIADDIFWSLSFQSGHVPRILGNDGLEVFAIGSDGTLTRLSDWAGSRVEVSPDQQWVTAIYASGTVELYNDQDVRVATISRNRVDSVVWRQDSLGFFIIGYSELSYYSIEKNTLEDIDACEVERCGFSSEWFAWSP